MPGPALALAARRHCPASRASPCWSPVQPGLRGSSGEPVFWVPYELCAAASKSRDDTDYTIGTNAYHFPVRHSLWYYL